MRSKHGDPACSCINSKIPEYNPLCVDSTCIQGGYATTPLLTARGSGCQIIDCATQINLANENIIVPQTVINQNCGQNSSPSPTSSSSPSLISSMIAGSGMPSIPSSTPSVTSLSPYSSSSESSSSQLMTFLETYKYYIVVFFIIILLGYIIL
jgi:hypothetical protein